VQLSRVAAWLDAPEAMHAKIDEAYDRTIRSSSQTTRLRRVGKCSA
jgi:hypothetical protein